METLWNYGIYLHDFNTSTFFDYCFAADLKPVVEKGLFFVENYNAEPPQHLDSFVQIVMEWVAFLSKRQSGEQLRPCVCFPFISGVAFAANGEG